MSTEKTQCCPACQGNFPQEGYIASTWGIKGEACRTCRRARQRKSRREHREEGKEAYAKWAAKQEPHHERNRQLQRKYKITTATFKQILARQFYKCLGCRRDITDSARVDHDHNTGLVRGLLCNNCNTALGMIQDDPATLRRLMVYLSHDRTQTTIYLIGTLRNAAVPDVAATLREQGYDVMDEWHSAGPEADEYWQAYEEKRGRSYTEALKGRAAQNTFLFDRAHIDLADCVVLVLPAGKSSHLELGYAMGGDKPGFILLDREPERYEVMPNFATAVCPNLEALMVELDKLYKGED